MGKVLFKKVRANAKLPNYATEGSSGMDVFACFESANDIKCPEGIASAIGSKIFISPGHRVLIPTGIASELPEGFELQVRSRSGLALKQGLFVLNSPGTIDSDYRGEIGVILFNNSNTIQQVESGERIAQLVLAKVEKADIEWAAELNETERGEGGFGSTGQ